MNVNEARIVLTRLVGEVRLLAAPASDQIAYLHELGVGDLADELALEFHDSYMLTGQLREAGLISDEVQTALDDLDVQLAGMSGPQNSVLWRSDALKHSAEWRGVRAVAEHVLILMGTFV